MKPTISGNQELGPLGIENGQMMESYRKLRDDRDEWKRKHDEGVKTLEMLDEEVKRLKAHVANYCSQPYQSEQDNAGNQNPG